MKTYFPPECGFTIEGNHIVTDGSVRHKVSGTSMAGILGVSPFNTPFQMACALLGLAKEDISNSPAVKVGVALEDTIIRYAGRTYPEHGTFCSAEEVYEKRIGDHDSWVSDFEDDVFAGHVDGIVFKDDGSDYILEIKTSRNLDSWKEGVPEYYRLQVSLYDHFITKKGKAYVVLGMVDENTYRDVNNWIPNANTVALFEMSVSEDFDEKLKQVRGWYDTYIMQGITPDYDPTNKGDVEMFEHLCALTRDIETVKGDVARYGDLVNQISQYESSIQNLYDERERLKASLRAYLECHSLSSLGDGGEYEGTVVLGVQNRKEWDEEAMKKDGIDPNKYKVIKQVKTFSYKKRK